MYQEGMTADFTELEKALPPIVFRNWRGWRDVLPLSPGGMANLDAIGQGPKERLICGRVTGYPRRALVEWLRNRSRIVTAGDERHA